MCNKKDNRVFYQSLEKRTGSIAEYVTVLEDYSTSLSHIGLNDLANELENTADMIDRHCRSIMITAKNFLAFGDEGE